VKVKVPESWAFFEDRKGTKHKGGAIVEIDEALAIANGFITPPGAELAEEKTETSKEAKTSKGGKKAES